MRAVGWGLVGLGAVSILLASACGGGGGEEVPPAPGTPVVLVSIDTLRSDHLPCYGYRGVETPALDALARDAVLFEHAYSHVPLTLPSHSSLLTGLLPPDHGVRDNVGYRLDAADLPYLPRFLHERGYATGAGVSAFVLRGSTGLAEGFDLYEDSVEYRNNTGLGGLQRPGGATLAAVLPWLRQVAGRPFFLFFHLYEPHTPYQAPERFAARYASPYDAEIAAADDVVGELVAELKRLGLYDRALLILVSDHGEGLGDHGEDEHGVLLYREALQVPLLVKLPGGRLAGRRVAAPAGLIDVFPTVAARLGVAPPSPLGGLDLVALATSPAPPARRIYGETFYPRLHLGWSDLACLTDGLHHYIEGPDPELYDLTADAGEEHNLLTEERRLYATLRDALATYDRTLHPPAEADEETREALASLGYVGSAAGASEGPLPDPKSQLPTLAELKSAFEHFYREEYEAAVPAFRRAIDKNPRMVDAWEYLARSLQKLRRYPEALDAYRQALELSTAPEHLAISAASLFLELGRPEEARRHAVIALDAEPSLTHGLLARVELAEGHLDAAEKEARQAMEERQIRLAPLITLGEVLHARGALEEALAVTDQAERELAARHNPDYSMVQGLYLLRGETLADLGRAEEAEAAFRREIELYPEENDAYTHLALLYALLGDPRAAGETLRRMVEANPTAAAYAAAVETLRVMGDERSAVALLRHARGLFPQSEELRGMGG